MDPNLLHLGVAVGLTLLFVVVTALIWRRAQVKTVFWWIGFTLLPMAVYAAGLAPAVVGAVQTLRLWWGTLAFTPIQYVGLALGALSVLLMLGSRLIPAESRADRRAAKAEKQKAKGGGRPGPASVKASPQPQSAPLPPGAGTGARTQARPASEDAEMDEIAALLRKRGIN